MYTILLKPGHDAIAMEQSGMHIRGIFVVDRVEEIKDTKQAQWKQIDEPNELDYSNRYNWFMAYMKAAKQQALAVTPDVDLGIRIDL